MLELSSRASEWHSQPGGVIVLIIGLAYVIGLNSWGRSLLPHPYFMYFLEKQVYEEET